MSKLPPVYTRTRSRFDNVKVADWPLSSGSSFSHHIVYSQSVTSRPKHSTIPIVYTITVESCSTAPYLIGLTQDYSVNLPNTSRGYVIYDKNIIRPEVMEPFGSYLAGFLELSDDTSVSVDISKNSDSISDCEVPGWRKKIQQGEVVNNACFSVKTKTTLSYDAGSSSVPSPEVYWTGYTWFVLRVLEEPVNTRLPALISTPAARDEFFASLYGKVIDNSSSLEDNAISDAFGKVNAGSFDYLVELAEGYETITYLAIVAKRIYKIYKAIRSGKFLKYAPRAYRKYKRLLKKGHDKFSKEVLDVLSGAWMEARYAIRPLLISAQDAVKLYQDGLKEFKERTTVRGKRSEQGQEIVSWEVVEDNVVYEYSMENLYANVSRSGVLLQMDEMHNNQRQLGFTALAQAGLEIIPLSFILEWFANLKGLIYTITPNIGVSPLTSWVTTTKYNRIQGNVAVRVDGEYTESMSFDIERDIYQRQIVDSPDLINLDIDFDIYKLLDLSAIVHSFTR